MKRLWILFAMLVMTGCVQKSGYRILKEEYETEYSMIYAEIIEFYGIDNKEYQSDLNIEIRDGIKGSLSDFNLLALEAKEYMPEGVKSTLNITYEVKRNSDGILSFIEEQYIYLGGAHGNTVWYPETIDLNSEKPHNMSLSELFADARYIDEINRNIDLLIEKNPEKYGELWSEPHIDEETGFYLTDEDLVIYFPPYELSYYAKGFIEFPIRLTEISGFLKEEYRV